MTSARDAHHVTRRAFLQAALGGSTLMLLAACGQASPAAAPPTAAPPTAAPSGAKPTSPPAAAAPAAPTSAPAAPKAPAAATGTLTLGVTNEPGTLDGMFANGQAEYVVIINVMEGLFTTAENLQVVPVLAESHRQVDDKTWEFKLRQGVTFHNGEPFDAQSVKVTYERSLNPDLKVRNTWAGDVNIERVEIVDPYTVRFHTKAPTPQMLARLANDHFMFPPKYVMENDPSVVARKPIGTGPYIFKEWNTGDRVTLESNPEYWGSPKPSIKTVVFKWVTEHTSRVANLKTGAFDIITPLDPTAIKEIQADAKLQVISVAGGRRVYAGLVTTQKPFDDVRVRQAMNYGSDIESITEAILGGATTRMKTWVNPPNENPELKGYTYDPAKAKQLLTEAGHPNGLEVTFDVDNGNYLKVDEFPQAVAASLRNIGVNANIRKIDRNVSSQEQRERKTSPMYLRSTAGAFDPGLDFQLLELKHAGNATQWDDPQFQGLLEKLYTGGTPDERKQWSFQAQARLMDQAPMLFLWKQPDIYAASKRVQRFKPNGDERIRAWQISLTS
jgi:peptide/nickel transport system substrate-binding protein